MEREEERGGGGGVPGGQGGGQEREKGALNARLLAEAVRHSEKSAKILPYYLVARHFKGTDSLSVPPLDS